MPASPRYNKLPFTIAIETIGGVATPIIKSGADLPASYTQTFSTAEDNQPAVKIQLCAGERSTVSENVAIGRFEFGSIPPAQKGVRS